MILLAVGYRQSKACVAPAVPPAGCTTYLSEYLRLGFCLRDDERPKRTPAAGTTSTNCWPGNPREIRPPRSALCTRAARDPSSALTTTGLAIGAPEQFFAEAQSKALCRRHPTRPPPKSSSTAPGPTLPNMGLRHRSGNRVQAGRHSSAARTTSRCEDKRSTPQPPRRDLPEQAGNYVSSSSSSRRLLRKERRPPARIQRPPQFAGSAAAWPNKLRPRPPAL